MSTAQRTDAQGVIVPPDVVAGNGGVDSTAVSPSVSGGDMAQSNSNNELSGHEGTCGGGGDLPPPNLPPSLSAVHTFLVEHALSEHWPVILAEGYDALDDLVELVQPNNKDLFEKLIPKSGHRLRMARLLTPRVGTATDLFAAASGLPGGKRGAGMHYAASSRSTLLGTDEGEDNGSVAGSIVSYASRATCLTMPTQHGGAYPTAAHQQRTLPKVMSYTNDADGSGLGSSSFAGVSQGASTATPSPSPQRTEASSASFANPGAAPAKQFLENPMPPAVRTGGRSTSTAASPVGTTSARVASRSPHRMSRTGGGGVAADGGGVDSSSRTSFIGQNGALVAEGSSPGRAPSSGPTQHVKMKVVVVGQGSCGKTSLIQRLVCNEFQQHMRATLGVDFKEKRFMVGSTVVALHFWDIWGQELATNATRSYYTGAKGAIVVYDACDEESLQKAVMWKKDLDAKARSQCNGLPIPVVLVGNKVDLAQSTVTSPAASSATLLGGRPAAGGGGGGSGVLVSFNNHPDAAGSSNNNFSMPPASSNNSSLARGIGHHPSSSGSVDRLIEGNDATVLKTKEEVQDFCNEHRFSGHFFTSAKTGENVRAVAEYLVLAVLKMEPLDGSPEDRAQNRNARVVTLDRVGQPEASGSPRSARGKKKLRCSVL